MPKKPGCTVFIGNLDEKVNDRVLYEIMVQAGQIVDIHIPRDRETNRHKGYAFVEYETEEIADYAVKLFSGVVSLNNRLLRFAISVRGKPSHDLTSRIAPTLNSPPKLRLQPIQLKQTEDVEKSLQLLPSRFSEYTKSVTANHPEEPPPRVRKEHKSELDNNFGYSRRILRATLRRI